MKCKKASLIINPRGGENLAKIPAVLAILAGAGWSTDLALKEYGGQALELATKAAEAGCDLVIAYGGDGTLNQVVNGVMHTQKEQHSIVGLLPGGTANIWARELSISGDPVKAALALINSDARKVDLGHVKVTGLTFLDETQEKIQKPNSQQRRQKKENSTARTHFLLMAGLGIDAAVMEHVSKSSKYQIGPLAVGASAVGELPKQHPFPVEIREDDGNVLWKGEALQVIIGNTRRYAEILEMTPEAYIDDGILNICVITAGHTLTTLGQIISLLWRHKPDNVTTQSFHGAHLSISVPASIALQLDGSAVKLKDYLSKSDREALIHAADAEKVIVTYRFDAVPQALQVAIPHTYDDALFKQSDSTLPQQEKRVQEMAVQPEDQISGWQEDEQPEPNQHANQSPQQEMQEVIKCINDILAYGRKINVIGASQHPDKKDAYIVAGSAIKPATGETQPVAVYIDKHVIVRKHTGEKVSSAIVAKIKEGENIIVEGKKSKRGVLRAKSVVI